MFECTLLYPYDSTFIISWKDQTVSGVWKQARSSTSLSTAFTKLSFSKVLLFTDTKARKDYFFQQSNFIKQEGQRDEFAELSTVIEGMYI